MADASQQSTVPDTDAAVNLSPATPVPSPEDIQTPTAEPEKRTGDEEKQDRTQLDMPVMPSAYLTDDPGQDTILRIPEGTTEITNGQYPDSYLYTEVFIPASVTSIGEGTFQYWKGLERVEFAEGSTLQSIGASAFSGCASLIALELPDTVQTLGASCFSDCESLEALNIPAGIPDIPNGCFADCPKLIQVTIPNSVTGIGEFAFYGCVGLTQLELPEKLETIGNNCFYGSGLTSVTVPEGVTSIGRSAFEQCKNLKTAVFPSRITEIPQSVFSGCGKLTGFTIPDQVTQIAGSAFSNCSSLEELSIPDLTESIERYAFLGCSSLKKLHIGSGFDRIMEFLQDCEALEEITVSKGNRMYESDENGVLFQKDNASLVYYPSGRRETSYTPPDYVKIIGEKAFYGQEWLEEVHFQEGLETIGRSAFGECTALKIVALPDSLREIGYSAFWKCTSLPEITIPVNVTTLESGAFAEDISLTKATLLGNIKNMQNSIFMGCSQLKEVSFSDQISVISGNMFKNCTALKEIQIPASVRTIGDSAFAGCTGLKKAVIPGSVTAVGYTLFQDCTDLEELQLQDGLGEISYGMFQNCSGLISIEIPKTVESVGSNAFQGCTKLTGIVIPNPKAVLESECLKDCTALENCTLPGGLQVIPRGLLANCENLKGLTLPDGLIQIGDDAFSGCKKLTKVIIPEKVEQIGSGAFLNCTGLVRIDIPDRLKELDYQTFSGCTSLEAITLPQGLQIIASSVFLNCAKLQIIRIPDTVTGIYSASFSGCSALKEITIPEGVTELNNNFKDCAQLTQITVKGGTTRLGDPLFQNCPNFTTICGPAGSYAGEYAKTKGYSFVAVGEVGAPVIETVDVTSYVDMVNEKVTRTAHAQVQMSNEFPYDTVLAEYSYDQREYIVLEKEEKTDAHFYDFALDVTAPEHDSLWFRITAYRGDIAGTPVTAMLPLDCVAPDQPAGFTASAEDAYILLNWDNQPVEENFWAYFIYRSESMDKDFEQIATISTVGYRDDAVESGVTYYYYIEAQDSWGNTSSRTPVQAARYVDTLQPEIVDYLPKTDAVQYRNIPIQIEAYDNYGLKSLELCYRGKGGADWKPIAVLTANSNREQDQYWYYDWDITDFDNGTYEMKMQVSDQTGLKSEPIVVEYAVMRYHQPPAVELSAIDGFRSVELSWNWDPQDSILENYIIYRTNEQGTRIKLAAVKAGSYEDRVKPGRYTYQVVYKNRFAEETWSQNIEASSLADDTQNPAALIALMNPAGIPGQSLVFDGSGSTDNDEIASYHWEFGDHTTAQNAVVSHSYSKAGTYQVKLTVTDSSGNEGTASVEVKIQQPDAASGKRLVMIRVADGDNGEGVGGAQILLSKPGDKEEDQIAVKADETGSAAVVLDADTVYQMAALKENSDYDMQDKTIEVGPAQDGPQPQKEEIRLSRLRFLVGSVTSRELSAQEIKDAGIDINDPANRNTYEFKLTLEYEIAGQKRSLPVTYYGNHQKGGFSTGGKPICLDLQEGISGGAAQGSWIHSAGTAYRWLVPLGGNENQQYFIILNGTVGWLKQIYEVSLVVANTSPDDWVEECTATIKLPEGLSLAGMNQNPQSTTVNVGTIGKQSQIKQTWYVRGDKGGSYPIQVEVAGTYYPEPAEPFKVVYTTEEPLEVVDTSEALELTVSDVPREIVSGETYPLTFTLENVTEITLNFITLEINGGGNQKSFEKESLAPGASVSFQYDTTMHFDNLKDGVEMVLAQMLLVCGNGLKPKVEFKPDDFPGRSELEAALKFYAEDDLEKEVESLTFSQGSFQFEKEGEDDTDYDCLHLYAAVTNKRTAEGNAKDATNVTVKIEAPEGFSFAPLTLKDTYEYKIPDLKVGEISEPKKIELYPIFVEPSDELPSVKFKIILASDVHKPSDSEKELPVKEREDTGTIPFRSTTAVANVSTGYVPSYWSYYKDSFQKSSYQYDHSVATLALALSSSVYRYDDIREGLLNIGFSNIKGYNFSASDTLENQSTVDRDSVANVFATKKVLIKGKIYTIVAIVIRGTVGEEWYGNFNIGTGTEHYSFRNSYTDVMMRLNDYMSNRKLQKEQTKLLITGHSRGAATANLVAADLDASGKYAAAEDIYAYTFATPNVTTLSGVKDLLYNNIFNILNDADFVTYVPPYEWGFDKYGITMSFPQKGSAAYEKAMPMVKAYFRNYTKVAFEEQDPGSVRRMTWLLTVAAKNSSEYENKTVGSVEFGKLMNLSRITMPLITAPIFIKMVTSAYNKGPITAHNIGNVMAALTLGIDPKWQKSVSFAHAVETYMSWMNTEDPQAMDFGARAAFKVAAINCPVDVEVYDAQGNLVGKIKDDAVDPDLSGDITAMVLGDSKILYLPSTQAYNLKLTGSGSGTMTYTISEYSKDGEKLRQVNFNDVPIDPGKTMYGAINEEPGTAIGNYALKSEEHQILKEADEEFSGSTLGQLEVTLTAESNGKALGAGQYTKGEYVLLQALPDAGNGFYGWYEGGQVVSDEPVYGFVIQKNRSLTARFVEGIKVPELPDVSQVPGADLDTVTLPDHWSWLEPGQELKEGDEEYLAIYTPAKDDTTDYSTLEGWDAEHGYLVIPIRIKVVKQEQPEPTPTGSPEPTPTGSPEPSPVPTAHPTQSPVPTPTVDPNPYPTSSPAPHRGGPDSNSGSQGGGENTQITGGQTGDDAPVLPMVLLAVCALAAAAAMLTGQRRKRMNEIPSDEQKNS